MNYDTTKFYTDREGVEYTFVRQTGNVTVFKEWKSDVVTCRNANGAYRWDNKQTEKDIVYEL